jgi:acyl-CoA synthetase (AMP-forming)/AMP-acid ligase II
MQYVAATYAAWMAGAVAVPLAVSHPPQELDYVIRDAGISAVRAAAASQASRQAKAVGNAGQEVKRACAIHT